MLLSGPTVPAPSAQILNKHIPIRFGLALKENRAPSKAGRFFVGWIRQIGPGGLHVLDEGIARIESPTYRLTHSLEGIKLVGTREENRMIDWVAEYPPGVGDRSPKHFSQKCRQTLGIEFEETFMWKRVDNTQPG